MGCLKAFKGHRTDIFIQLVKKDCFKVMQEMGCKSAVASILFNHSLLISLQQTVNQALGTFGNKQPGIRTP
ncbi:MAG: hypothetical protein EA361_05600 [Bacteroidetes bacterium]|nr:MAG: hypothetical protein EA361_05600 [Bacteroidota bacterium]